MTTRTGTSHFVSLADAIRYYRPYGTDKKAVLAKIEAGEIHLGKPLLKPGQKLLIDRSEGRYIIEG